MYKRQVQGLLDELPEGATEFEQEYELNFGEEEGGIFIGHPEEGLYTVEGPKVERMLGYTTVSYTHLDVYKRQVMQIPLESCLNVHLMEERQQVLDGIIQLHLNSLQTKKEFMPRRSMETRSQKKSKILRSKRSRKILGKWIWLYTALQHHEEQHRMERCV